MFTGIIEELGRVKKIKRSGNLLQLSVEAKKVMEEVKEGDSIALNGVCLSITYLEKDSFKVDIMLETLKRTTLGELKVGDRINLERALRVSDRLGGHIVTGHIDGVGIIGKREGENIEIISPQAILPYIAPQGSIAVEGISLTVVEQKSNIFTVSLIPYTLQNTTLGFKKEKEKVNLEVDILGKYVKRLLGKANTSREITKAMLEEYGYVS